MLITCHRCLLAAKSPSARTMLTGHTLCCTVCTVFTLTIGSRLNYHWVLCRWFSTSEGILACLWGSLTNQVNSFIHDGRIFSIQNIWLVENLTNSISRNECKAANLVFHHTMFSIMKPVKFNGFYCCLTWEILVKLSGSLPRTSESNQIVNMG